MTKTMKLPLSPKTIEHIKAHKDVYRLQMTFDNDPRFRADYQLLHKIGEGTFSTVYKAIDKRAHAYADANWGDTDGEFGLQECRTRMGSRTRRESGEGASQGSSAASRKSYVAIKRIYATSAPYRILNELELLYELRGSVHVSTVVCTHRFQDQVVAVLPYQEHTDFRLWYQDASHLDCQIFTRDLLAALAHVHSKSIIHRDVKPSNFLWDHQHRRGVLCDFGLAALYDTEQAGKCKHAPYVLPGTSAERRGNALESHVHPGPALTTLHSATANHVSTKAPGILKQDSRPAVRANRAGTRGFRAPEVLLKCPDQTMAIDIWSVGVTLLSLFTARFPFFQSNDDNEALMEVAHLIGKKKMKACAIQHNRIFHTNVPDITPGGRSFRDIIKTLNPRFFLVDIDEVPRSVAAAQAHSDQSLSEEHTIDRMSPGTRQDRIKLGLDQGHCLYADTPSLSFWDIKDPERAWRTGEREEAYPRDRTTSTVRYSPLECYAIKLYSSALDLLDRLLDHDYERRLTAQQALDRADSFCQTVDHSAYAR